MFSTVAVVGAGTMGQGIAQLLLEAGLTVHIYDRSPGALGLAVDAITRRLQRRTEAETRSAGSLRVVESVDQLGDADLVIEAVPEHLELKRTVFAELDRHLPPAAILASNTSGLDIDVLAQATTRPQRVVGLHFFNPPPLMPLVELVPAATTDGAVLDVVRAFTESLGKTAITVANRPGFIVNRLLFAMIAEAGRILDEGETSAQDVDRALCLGASHPIGPLALADFIGLDVSLDILESLASGLGERYTPPSSLRDLVAQGHLGRKSGRGFHSY
ncbi:MAG TPA: 3-hydroxyacyl-CoA dehydrogenase family protein [Candidatus Latescibacteria bacterium]|jgi:3-hydroxybutyryl-CoA dehydrogenase|nr:3-hydroxybutyryl-CoA dehydrogenase [Gemmatimonadaceae bacterium]HJP29843.1 3-hydroxyacyl-CoA dehydrogenase family protein [Candidatus Latescibacterota bacterium]